MYTLVVVGSGGTGTYFLKEFSRFIHGTEYLRNFRRMIIFDGDIVEGKNLARQCFQEEDIGRNKAAVMAEILNDAFDLKWESYPVFLTEMKQLNDVAPSYDTPIIISCVDNHACRLLLEDFFNKRNDCIYFDSANEFETGECVYSYKKGGNVEGPVRSYYFPDILRGDHKKVTELSCEELNNADPQHIFTNMLAGNLLCSGMAKLMEKKHTPGVAYFNAMEPSCDFVEYKPSPVK